MELVEIFEREVEGRVGADATFEQRQNATAAFAAEVLSNLLYQAEEEDQPEGHRPIARR
jgi:hypothetical protein